MRHQRHFAEPARALVGVEHLVEHVLAPATPWPRRCGRPRSAPGCRRSACPDGDSGLVLATCAVDAQRVRRGEHFLGRDVGIAGDAVLGRRRAALPFDGRRPGRRSGRCPGPVKCSAGKRLPFSQLGARVQRRHCAPPRRRPDRRRSTREAAKIASASLRTATSSASSGNTCLAQAGVGIGDDVPVDVEAGDLFQRRLVGHRIGAVGARHLVRVLRRPAASGCRRQSPAAPRCWQRPWPCPHRASRRRGRSSRRRRGGSGPASPPRRNRTVVTSPAPAL